MGEIRDFSVTATSNGFSSAEGGMPEGMDFRDVNDSARERMAALRRWIEDNNGVLAATEISTNVYRLTPNADVTPEPSQSTPVQNGLTYAFTVPTANTGTATLEATDGTTTLGPYEVWSNDTVTVCPAGDLRLNAIHFVTLKQISGTWRWLLINPVAGVNLEAQTLNALSDQPVFAHSTLQVEDAVHVGIQPDELDHPNLVLGPSLVGTWPLLLRDQANEPANSTDAQQFALGFMHGLTELLGFLGFMSGTQGSSVDLRLQNNVPDAGIVLAGATSGGRVENRFDPQQVLLQTESGSSIDMNSSGGIVLRNGDDELGFSVSTATVNVGADTNTTSIRGASQAVYAGDPGVLVFEANNSAVTLGDAALTGRIDGSAITLDAASGNAEIDAQDDIVLDAADSVFLEVGTGGANQIRADKLICSETDTLAPNTGISLTLAQVGKTLFLQPTSGGFLMDITCNFDPGIDGARIRLIGQTAETTVAGGYPNFNVLFNTAVLKYGVGTTTYDLRQTTANPSAFIYSATLELVWIAAAQAWKPITSGPSKTLTP